MHRIRDGSDAGKWSWSMTASLPRSKDLGSTSGIAVSRQEAVRLVEECYEHMLTYYNTHRPEG